MMYLFKTASLSTIKASSPTSDIRLYGKRQDQVKQAGSDGDNNMLNKQQPTTSEMTELSKPTKTVMATA